MIFRGNGDQSPKIQQKTRLSGLLTATILLAFLLRIINLHRDAVWLDEAISVLAARLPLPLILNNTIQSSHPPVYYLLLKGWMTLLPAADPLLKLLSVFLNLLLIPTVFQLGRRLIHRRAGLAAAFLIAISPFQLIYSHELRMYTLVMLLVSWLALAYWQARQTGNVVWWLFFALLALTAVYTHLFSFLVLAAIGLHALFHHRDRRSLFYTAGIIALVLLAFLPWLQLILGEAQQELGSLRPLTSPTPRQPLLPLTTLAFLLFGQSFNPLFTGLILFALLATAALLPLEWRKLRRQIPAGLPLLALVALVTWGVPLLVYLIRPFFLPARTMAAAAPFLLLLLGWLLTLPRRSPLPYLAGLMGILMVAGLFFYHTGPPLKPPYREVTTLVAEHRQPGDLVLHTSDGSYLPTLRYVTWTEHALLVGDPDPRKPAEVYTAVGGTLWEMNDIHTAAADRLWLIVAREHSVAWQNDRLATFRATWPVTETWVIEGIEIILFQLD